MLTRRVLLAGSVAAVASAVVRQASGQNVTSEPPCPVAPVPVVAVENQYGSIVQQLGGRCAEVTSIMSNPNADPHEFQTDIAVARAYQRAARRLAVGTARSG